MIDPLKRSHNNTLVDLLIGLYGFGPINGQVITCLMSMKEKCDLDRVRVVCIERTIRPVSAVLRGLIPNIGFELYRCPQPALKTCVDDTGSFCDWMVDNIGTAPWVTICHFDVVFTGDYTGFVKCVSPMVDMVGEHHNGAVTFRRTIYENCSAKFRDTDVSVGCDDVGNLFALRAKESGARHLLLSNRNGKGKCNMFDHLRQGSYHNGPTVVNDTQPHLYENQQ